MLIYLFSSPSKIYITHSFKIKKNKREIIAETDQKRKRRAETTYLKFLCITSAERRGHSIILFWSESSPIYRLEFIPSDGKNDNKTITKSFQRMKTRKDQL